MSPPVLIVSEQLNYTKPDGTHATFMPVMINFQGAYALIQVRSLSNIKNPITNTQRSLI